MKPKEGTILTIARAIGDKASEMAKDETDLVIIFEEIIKYAEEVLSQTPDMLPVLNRQE